MSGTMGGRMPLTHCASRRQQPRLGGAKSAARFLAHAVVFLAT